MADHITITLAERPHTVPAGTTLHALRAQVKPDADLTTYNGAVANADLTLHEGDTVVFIRRGEVPAEADLEALMAARHTPGVHAILKRSCVGIAGAGGLGSAIAIALARIGVGRLIIVDFDVVEPSNLNRQQYFVDQLGLPKVAALKENLTRINPYVRVDVTQVRLTPENVPILFADAQVLIEAFDAADQKAMLVESYGRACPGRPMVVASGLAGHGSSNSVVTRKLGPNLYVVGDLTTGAQPGTGLMAPRVGIAAHHQANAALRLLLGEAPDA